jgi:hypothetical protein
MKISSVITAFLWFAILVAGPGLARAEEDPLRHGNALLIGVSAYVDPRWPPLNDIQLELERLKAGLAPNFDNIETLIDPDWSDLSKGLRRFLRKYGNEKNGRLFLYYAGHGYTEKDIIRGQYRGLLLRRIHHSWTALRPVCLRHDLKLFQWKK